MIIFWAITPFQNAFFSQSVIRTMEEVQLFETSQLLTLEQQKRSFSVDFLYTSYNIAWGGLDPPPFTTRSAAYTAALPLHQAQGTNSTCRYSATEYAASLDCKAPLEFNRSFFDNKGCSFSWDAYGNGESPANFAAFVGSNDRVLDVARGNCTLNGHPQFALWWVYRNRDLSGANNFTTSLFCTPVYTTQDVEIEVNEEGAVLSTATVGQRNALDVGIFDFETFEGIVDSQVLYDENALDSFPVNSGPTTPPFSFRTPDLRTVGIAGFAIPLGPTQYTEYRYIETLQETFEAAYALLFAMALNSLRENSTDPRLLSGNRYTQQEALIIVKPFTVLLECSLVLILFLGLLFLYLTRHRISKLRSDPSSLSHLMSLTSESATLIESARYRVGNARIVPSDQLSLQEWDSGAPYRLDVLLSSNVLSERRKHRVLATSWISKSVQTDSPLESSLALCSSFIIFQAVVLGFGAFLWTKSLKNFGE